MKKKILLTLVGIHFVFANGILVSERGEQTGALSGETHCSYHIVRKGV